MKYAKDLILKVRLALLSDETITQLMDKSNTCTNNADFIKFLDGILEYKNRIIRKNFDTNLSSRYCNQKKLNILVCGGCENFRMTVKDVKCVDVIGNGNVTIVPPLLAPRLKSKVVCVKDELYVFGGQGYDNILEMVGKYSFTSNEWTEVGRMYDDRKFFCICSFMNKILIIGGTVGIGIKQVICHFL